jgi:hypothetical protein
MRLWRNTRRIPSPGRRLLCCAVLALLPGCQPSGPDAPFTIYLAGLGAVLSVATPDLNPTTVPSPPRSGELLLDMPPSSLDGLDFLALSGCAVQATVVKRNSSLGRQAKPSQRLMLELEYLRLAPPCITRLRGSNKNALADILEEAWRLRREQLPALIFNATLGSDEYRAFWLAAPAPGQFPRVSRAVATAALDAINNQTSRWLGGDYEAQNRDFEILLSEVAGGDGGALLQALYRQGDWLAAADRMLERRLAHSPLCSTGKRDIAATMLSTVIRWYFNDAIQTRADRTDRRYHQLLPPIAALETQLATTLPQRYRSWMNNRNQRVAALTQAPHHHLEQLERIQRQCSTN